MKFITDRAGVPDGLVSQTAWCPRLPGVSDSLVFQTAWCPRLLVVPTGSSSACSYLLIVLFLFCRRSKGCDLLTPFYCWRCHCCVINQLLMLKQHKLRLIRYPDTRHGEVLYPWLARRTGMYKTGKRCQLLDTSDSGDSHWYTVTTYFLCDSKQQRESSTSA